MRYLCVFIALGAMSVNVYAEGPSAVRPIDPWAGETLDRATRGSAFVRQLVAVIENENVIVHVVTAMVMPPGLGGMTQFVTAGNGYRYLRVTLLRSLDPQERATLLGHELQHACEIAASGAADHDAVRRLFEDLSGRTHGRDLLFETKAAMMAERRVLRELRGRSASVPGSR